MSIPSLTYEGDTIISVSEEECGCWCAVLSMPDNWGFEHAVRPCPLAALAAAFGRAVARMAEREPPAPVRNGKRVRRAKEEKAS